MGHKNNRRIAEWLKDLRDKQYVEWIYSTNFTEKTKPAIYYLGINGIRFLRACDVYPPEELRRRYKESTREQSFVASCVSLADYCLELIHRNNDGKVYSCMTKADYALTSGAFHYLNELKPDLCFTVKDRATIQTYLFTQFNSTIPRYMIKKKIRDHMAYLSEDWGQSTDGMALPIVLFACPTKAELIYAKRLTRKLLESGAYDKLIHIRFATFESIKQCGITGLVWEEA